MKVQAVDQVALQPVQMDGATGCQVRWLVSKTDGAPHFAMRLFEVAPGGHTPRHHHPYEHEIFVLEGEGLVYQGDRPHELKPGTTVLVEADEIHQFRNTGNQALKFLCLIPNSADNRADGMKPECSSVAAQQ